MHKNIIKKMYLPLMATLCVASTNPVMAASKTYSVRTVGNKSTVKRKTYTKVKTSNAKVIKVTKSKTKFTMTSKKAGKVTLKYYKKGKLKKKEYVLVASKSQRKVITSKLSLKKGSTTIKSFSKPSGSSISYSSSNKNIASVDSKGKIIANNKGSATIYAKITYHGKSVVTHKTYVTVEEKEIVALNVSGPSSIVQNVELKREQLKVEATYTDKTKGIITDYDLNFSSKTLGKQPCIVSYRGLKTTLYIEVEKAPAKQTGIQATLKPTATLSYGESLSKDDFDVNQIYDDLSIKPLTTDDFEITGFSSKSLGKQTITVINGKFSCKIEVEVINASKIKIESLKDTITLTEDHMQITSDDVKIAALFGELEEEHELSNDDVVYQYYDESSNSWTRLDQEEDISYGLLKMRAVYYLPVTDQVIYSNEFNVTYENTQIEHPAITQIVPSQINKVYTNDELTEDDIEFAITYEDGSTDTLTGNFTSDYEPKDIEGIYPVNIVYNDGFGGNFNCSLNLEVTDKSEKPKVVSIEATMLTSVLVGNEITADDCEIIATYDDNNTKIITSGFTTNLDELYIKNNNMSGTYPVTITYEGKTCQVQVKIVSPIKKLEAEYSGPYIEYDSDIDIETLEGLNVTATYEDGTISELLPEDYGFSYNYDNAATKHSCTLFFEINDIKTSIDIPLTVTKLEVDKSEAILKVGDSLDINNFIFKATYSDGNTGIVDYDNITWNGYTAETITEGTPDNIEFSYAGQIAIVNVTVE